MIKLLHFADAHIDIVKHGRHDPQSGLPVRVIDFLKALDTIVDAAIEDKVDLVLFAGDAYRDRTPVPTFQREWGKRIYRLSEAGICTILLVGNHDLSPSSTRAHALQEFVTLQVPHITVVDKPCFLKPQDLGGLPLQVIALPWVSRAGMLAALQDSEVDQAEALEALEERLTELIQTWIGDADPDLPLMLAAHASVQGAKYGAERSVMLGSDLVLPAALVRDPRLDYVGLGHIHKAQNLNEGQRPPVIYPGSIERVDFGEAGDDKFYVTVNLPEKHGEEVKLDWHKLEGRRFIDLHLELDSPQDFNRKILEALPGPVEAQDSILRFTLEYPREYESMLDETAIREQVKDAFEFHFIRRPQMDTRLRLPDNQAISSLSHLELLEKYWQTLDTPPEEIEELKKLAAGVISAANGSQQE